MAFIKPQESVSGAKVLVYGRKSSGKTTFALSFPGIALIDAEAGSVWYRDTDNYKKNVLLLDETMSYTGMEESIEYIGDNHEEEGVKTLVTDSVTKVRENLKETIMTIDEKLYRKKGKDVEEASLSVRSYGRIAHKSQLHDNMKIDISKKGVTYVDIAQAKEIKEKVGENFVHKGWEPDIQKQSDHNYDLQLFFYTEQDPITGSLKYLARVEKERLGVFKPGDIIENPTYDLWAEVIEARQSSGVVDNTSYVKDLESAQKVYEQEADTKELSWDEKIKDLVSKLDDLGKKELVADLKKNKTIPPFEGMTANQAEKLQLIYNKYAAKV